MKRFWLALGLLVCLGIAPAQAQNVTNPSIFAGAGAYNSAPPTCTAGQFCLFQTDSHGILKVVPSGTPSGTQDVNVLQYGSVAVGAMANYGTSPGAVKVPGVNAFVTNTITQTPNPSSASSAGVAPAPVAASQALASNQVIKGSAGNLYSFEVSADSTLSGAAWWIMIFNATSLPSNGAVTPLKCYALPSGATSYSAAFPNPAYLSTGITIGVSTTGCFTLTASIHAFISGDAQ